LRFLAVVMKGGGAPLVGCAPFSSQNPPSENRS